MSSTELKIFRVTVAYVNGTTVEPVFISAVNRTEARAEVKSYFKEAETAIAVKSVKQITNEEADDYWGAIDLR
jgi:hypothetical protein